jgi:photosystem II stability/assembly factor-like uncharacterized protein
MLTITFLLQLLTTFTSPATVPPADSPNLYRSTDMGRNWIPFAEGLPEKASPSQLVEDKGRLYLATDYQGVYVLNVGASKWEARNQGLPDRNIDINSLAVRGDFLAIGTYHGKVFTSKNGGRRWQRPIFNFMGGSVRALYCHEGWLIAGTDNGIYRSADDGMTWQQTDDLVQVNDIASFKGRLFAARRDGIVVSDDDGKSWAIAYNEGTVTQLIQADGKLYGRLIADKYIRSKNGAFWELPIMAIPGSWPKNLPAALWGGFKPENPAGDVRVRSVTENSFGWFLGISGGC